jgi:hypothetical protein
MQPLGPRGQNPHYPWHTSYKTVVDQTAAIIEGVVTAVENSYNEQEGPRTLVTFSELRLLWGDLRSTTVTLKLFGGTVPGRRGRVDEVHTPSFVRNKRYLVFLSNRDWRLSPVTARQSFIIERVQGKDIVVTTDGFAVFGIDDIGGPIRKFPVHRIPNEIDESFVPQIESDITAAMIAGVYSAQELVADLKVWGSRNGVSPHGTFNDQPYVTGSWRFPRTAPNRASAGRVSGKEFAPRSDRASRPPRERNACGEHTVPTDSDPRDRSSLCVKGGVR